MCSNKRKIAFLVLFVSIIINIAVVVAKSASHNTLELTNVEAFAAGENGPGNYKGARNQYCTKPKGQTGCVADTDPTKTCSYSIYCIQ